MIRAEPITEAEAKRAKGIQSMALGRSDLLRMDPRDLRVESGWNVRVSTFDPKDEDDITLAKSIAENGVRQPLTVYMKDGEPTVTDGHRRLAAALYALDHLGATFPSVPVQTEIKGADEADRVLSMETRNGGKPLSPIERAALYSRLIGLGRDEGWIATKTGRSRQYVSNLLSLREGPAEVVRMVEVGEISATLALQTLREKRGDGEAATATLYEGLKKAQAEGKTKATAKHVARPAPDLTKSVGYAAGMKRAAEMLREAGMADAAALVEAATPG